jgi:hypothetical protein
VQSRTSLNIQPLEFPSCRISAPFFPAVEAAGWRFADTQAVRICASNEQLPLSFRGFVLGAFGFPFDIDDVESGAAGVTAVTASARYCAGAGHVSGVLIIRSESALEPFHVRFWRLSKSSRRQ